MSEEISDKLAEVLRLSMVEGLSMRAIARRLSMSRKTIRKILGRPLPSERPQAKEPRYSILDPYEDTIRAMLSDMPDLLAPSMLERLRPLGYTVDQRFSFLAKHQDAGRTCDYVRRRYRKFPQGSHVIFYRPLGDGVIEIVRILHRSRDVDRTDDL